MILLLNVQFQVYSISIKIKSTPLQFPEFFMYKTQILRTQIVAVQILRETAMLQFGKSNLNRDKCPGHNRIDLEIENLKSSSIFMKKMQIFPNVYLSINLNLLETKM